MTSVFHLVRHGTNDLVGKKIVGRTPGVHLNSTGLAQAENAAEWLARKPLDQIYSSPLERARETANPLSMKLGLTVRVLPELLEVDYGDWTGMSLEELDRIEGWKRWNAFRSGGQIPNGETMWQVQARMVALVERLRRDHPGEQIALFSHGDPIRVTLLYYLGLSTDFLLRLEIGPGSVSTLEISDWAPRVLCVNFLPPDVPVQKDARRQSPAGNSKLQ